MEERTIVILQEVQATSDQVLGTKNTVMTIVIIKIKVMRMRIIIGPANVIKEDIID